MNLETVRIFLMTRGFDLGTKVLGAIVLWIIGRWVIGVITGLLRKLLSRNGRVDPTLAHYLGSILGALLNLLLILAILQVFGVQTTSFAALLAGLGLAIGTAWGGLLAHFAAGIFMQVLRPFKVGDFVMAGGVTGTVSGTGPVRHDDHHAGQCHDDRRQQQDLLRHDLELQRAAGAPRRTDSEDRQRSGSDRRGQPAASRRRQDS